ncbi:FkbM family methyltransferase [Ignavibacterium sp.]|uniref:FkbM family methyltransferase n=1 Tax=Ignavibacterium sp. TaxID=2651167 RepID=UPI00307E7F34
MINISKINYRSSIGKLLRLTLKLIPDKVVLPILQGKLKGKKWIKGSSINGCWLGTYEFKKQILFDKYVKSGMVVYDIGANAGFYTLLSAILTGSSGKVFAFEPVPKNIFYIKKHLALNKITNTVVVEKAVSNKITKLRFTLSSNPSTGHISNEGEIEVETIILDEFVKQGNPLPDLIKVDIEGAEFDALTGAKELLKVKKPVIFLATHGEEVKEKCIGLLKEYRYNIKPIGNLTIEHSDEFICE